MAGGRTRVQKNKAHKTRFAAKSQRNQQRVAQAPSNGSARTAKPTAAVGKAQRQSMAKQRRDQQRAQLMAQRRGVKAGAAAAAGPRPLVVPEAPRLLVFVGLSEEVNVDAAELSFLEASCFRRAVDSRPAEAANGAEDMEVDAVAAHRAGPSDATCASSCGGARTVSSQQFKSRFQALAAQPGDLARLIELTKIADIIVFCVNAHGPSTKQHSRQSSAEGHVDQWGRTVLSVIRAQGLPLAAGLVLGLQAVGPAKRMAEARKSAAEALQGELPKDSCRVFSLDSDEEKTQMVRHLSQQRLQTPVWRTQRPYVVANEVRFEPAQPQGEREGEAKGSLHISGYLRGRGICVNQLVHVTNGGDFQLESIEILRDPHPWNPRHALAAQKEGSAKAGDAMDEDAGDEPGGAVLRASEGLQEPLMLLNAPDPLAGEQTWPTEQEMKDADGERRQKATSRRIRVPKGTSSYQASWFSALADEEEDEDSEDEEAGDDPSEPGLPREQGSSNPDLVPEDAEGEAAEELEEDEEEEEESGGEEDDEEDEEEMRARWMAERRRLKERQKEDEEFPDEIDTPMDVPARVRFAKYRGLKSFRTSPWDPKESLPVEYGRIFAFDNVKRTHKAALARADAVDRGEIPSSITETGAYIRAVVKDVPAAVAENLLKGQGRVPPVLTGLLQFESHMSVLHLSVRKLDSHQEAVKSKQLLQFHMGFRVFDTRPIFSTDDINGDKHKLERFLHAGRYSVASVYAPATFAPLPLLVLDAAKPGSQGAPQAALVATGSLRGPDVDRIILKKIVLSGYPVTVRKKKAVVHYMFHNPEDVRWFKPVELYTKYGRRGRIKEPVGTKGRMKCVFDGVVQQRDAVCMSLYKRVYPKWDENVPLMG